FAGTAMLAGVYTFGAVYCHVVGYFTNTAPVDAYRGAGRPEANYVTERIVDLASRELGIAPDELRRRNFIPPSAMPYTTALDTTYDSGEFAQNLTDAMKFADWDGFPARKAASKAKGMLRGRGLITYVEACGGGSEETAQLRFDSSGGATILIGNQSNGQGHETAYAQMVSERLGVPMDSVRVIQGDTDTVLYPGMTGGSRALAVSGSAVGKAVERVIAKGKKIAAHVLEAAEADIEFDGKDFRIAGTDKAKSFVDIVKTSFVTAKLPADMSIGIDETGSFQPPGATYPNGCHIAEVEIDPNTGEVKVLDYTVVDDFGNVMNPMMVEGQVHGGVAQGLGQALLENCVYDPETGQLLTGSFMDYAMPRAYDLPPIRFAYNEVPCRNNPLGVKGAGEAGAIGAPPSIIAAVVDALAEYGVKHIDMPATPEKVWRLIQAGSAKAAAE
ncbi:MAG: molybdopterin-dependent oxidoreductase, partial [Alphaproteobacteria bacterium]|nr:molybdopterin-dependent oxidoreductase [Alphaproteobacteria bacterium]